MTAVTAQALEQILRTELAPVCFGRSASDFAVDGIEPAVVVSPASTEDVASCLRLANDTAAAVLPWGGGSRMGLGMPPERYDLALDIARLDQVVEYEPADLTITVQAGVKLRDLQALLAKEGQWLPLDPPAAPASTIGGVLAANASGPARIAHGAARDLVIGMTVVTAEGQMVKSGGRVVKNVAGYDMAKMHIGALGTLGVIVQASLKVAPLPKSAQTFVIESEDTAVLAGMALEVRDAGLPASGIALSRALGGLSRLAVRFAGTETAVGRSGDWLLGAARERGLNAEQAPAGLWNELAALRDGGAGALFRVSHAVSRSPDTVRLVAAVGADVLACPTAGLTFGRLLALGRQQQEAVRLLRASVEAEGGSLVLEAAPREAKETLGVWGSPPPEAGLMRSLKEQMDPNGILSPGRFVAGL